MDVLTPDEYKPDSLDLDPSDPLNLLINSDSSMEDASTPSHSSDISPPQWSQLSTLWPHNPTYFGYGDGMKYPDLGMDFTTLDSLDSFNPSLSVDPSSLMHFDGQHPSMFMHGELQYPMGNELFPFTFTPNEFGHGSTKPRRLSITSSSSSSGSGSGGTLSPIIAPAAPSGVMDPADELAERVRQSAGVMLAVPGGMPQQSSTPIPPRPNVVVPRVRPQNTSSRKRSSPSTTKSSSPSMTSSPGPESPVITNPSSAFPTTLNPGSGIAPQQMTSIIGRPKTSHTTIERRYRTNLNARIQSLRQAVPALRVLESMGKENGNGEDVIDDRGFVDGVKVARKGSKANVLGKAVEYIRVLKKREARLKKEQNGLKSLLGGLVGGPALLREWEREWKEKFGGEEQDEVEGEDMEAASDEEEGDGDEEGDEDEGRARKKVKLVKVPKKEKEAKEKKTISPVQTVTMAEVDGVVPEKRKRGRPRKVLPSPAEGEKKPTSDEPESEQGSPSSQGQQYLLATFALFSFFNSPLTSSSGSQHHSHSHTGTVLGHSPTTSPGVYEYGWREAIQGFHLLVSGLLFFSIVMHWLPKKFTVSNPVLSALSQTKSSASAAIAKLSTDDRTALIEALSSRGAQDEEEKLRGALGVGRGMIGLVHGIVGGRKSSGLGFELKGLEQRAWVRLGELAALDHTTPLTTRLQTYWSMSTHISWFTASTSDLCTLALIIRPVHSGKADDLWERARNQEVSRGWEKLVVEAVGVKEAGDRLAAAGSDSGQTHTPLELLANMVLREKLKGYAAKLFVRTVLPDHEVDDEDADGERSNAVEAATELGGQVGEFASALDGLWKGVCDDIDNLECDEEISSLLRSLILYRRIFPSSSSSNSGVLSPPPSPSRKNFGIRLALKRALGSVVFDRSDVLEDARDRVVDMLFEFERAERR